MKARILRGVLLLGLLLAIVLAIINRDQLTAEALQTWIASAGMAAPLAFILIYALATVLFLPGSLLSLAGGVIFGPVWGTLYNLTGATLGASLAFLLARYFAASWLAQHSPAGLNKIKLGVEAEGWRFVAFVRLVPVFPFNALNYVLGLTRIPFQHYVLASAVCMFPGALALTYLGYAGREAAAGGEGLIQKMLLALALLASSIFLPHFVKRLRNARNGPEN